MVIIDSLQIRRMKSQSFFHSFIPLNTVPLEILKELESIKMLSNKELKDEIKRYNLSTNYNAIGNFDRKELEVILAENRIQHKNQKLFAKKIELNEKMSEAEKIQSEINRINSKCSYFEILEQLRRNNVEFDPLADRKTLVTCLALTRLKLSNRDHSSVNSIKDAKCIEESPKIKKPNEFISNLFDVDPELEKLREFRQRKVQKNIVKSKLNNDLEPIELNHSSAPYTTSVGINSADVTLRDEKPESNDKPVTKHSSKNIKKNRRVIAEIDSFQLASDLIMKSSLGPILLSLKEIVTAIIPAVNWTGPRSLAVWIRGFVLSALRRLAIWAGGDRDSGSLVIFYCTSICLLMRKGVLWLLLSFFIVRTLRLGLVSSAALFDNSANTLDDSVESQYNVTP
jgi:hypothetical protein